MCLAAVHPLLGQTSFPKQFVTPQQLAGPVGDLIGTGDINGDGRPDIVYTNNVQIATGPGTFRNVVLTVAYQIGSKLLDVNGDGKLDIVEPIPAYESCDQYPDGTWYCDILADAAFMVFPGNGDGTFQSGYGIDLGDRGAGTPTLAMADVNGDGRPDALVSFSGDPNDGNSNRSFVLLNDATGHFHIASSTSALPVQATGDFNGDGKVDLVVAGVSIFYGNGDGTFTPGPAYGPAFSLAVAVGDFNRDGHPDLAATDGNSGIYVLWGQANGTFTNPTRISTFQATGLQAADLNNDGYSDLVAGLSSFAVFTNLRNGTFSNPRIFAGTEYSSANFGLANFNADQYLDLVWGNKIAYGSYGAEFLDPQITLYPRAGFVAAADFNGDHIDDVAVASQSSPTLTVFPGSGQGYFNTPATYSVGVTNGMVAVGDVNGDGISDVVVARNVNSPIGAAKDVSVLFGNGDGTFRAAVSSKVLGVPIPTTLSGQFYAVDVNRDGKADLVGDWGVALGYGDGTFAAPTPFPSPVRGPFSGISVGDFNRDGHPDIVVGTFLTATVYTLLGDGNGGFTLSNTEKLNYTKPYLNALTTADMNADGIPDLIYEYSATPSRRNYDRIVVELGDGTGLFGNANGTRVNYNGSGYDRLLVGDFNRDGRQDVVVLTVSENAGATSGESISLRGYGNGTLSSPQYFPLQMLSGVVLDLNGDGAPDIVGPSIDPIGVERCMNTHAQ